ncbi:MAG: DUF4465 domain-containing protein [Bacteroidales bacterium]|nr:DUF4465 domain-containing protein [Bacteroidales bacterium]
MRKVLLLIVILTTAFAMACTKEEVKTDIVDFEELDPGASGYWNGSDGEGGFYSGNAFFVNDYNDDWGVWSGFAYTNHTDTETGDYTNQYSSITGTGAGLSDNYSVFYYTGSPDTILFSIEEKVESLALCNTTYSYKVMLNGNDFAKKFGGTDGSDPDWFKLIITPLDNDMKALGSVEFYLADFRSDDSSEDYILDTWQTVDLSEFGFIKAMVFALASSDTGDWGINNPAYVCLDNIEGVLIPEE